MPLEAHFKSVHNATFLNDPISTGVGSDNDVNHRHCKHHDISCSGYGGGYGFSGVNLVGVYNAVYGGFKLVSDHVFETPYVPVMRQPERAGCGTPYFFVVVE